MMHRFIVVIFFWLFSLHAIAMPVYVLPVISASQGAPQSSQATQAVALSTGKIIINPSVYRQYGIHTVSGLLHSAIGAYAQGGSMPNSEIYLKGKPAMVMLNGVPLSNFSMQDDDLNIIPFTAIAKVVVTSSADGVRYGNQTTGSVINIITKKAGSDPNNITFTAGYPWQSGLSLFVNHKWQSGWFATGTLSGNYNNGYRVHSQNSHQNVRITLGKDYGQSAFSGTLWTAHDDMNYAGALDGKQLNKPTGSVESRQSRYRTLTSGASAHWHQQLVRNWFFNVDSLFRHQAGRGQFPGESFSEDYDNVGITPTLTGTTAIWGHKLKSTLGTDITYDDYSDSFSPLAAKRKQFAGFYQLMLPIAKGLSVKGGYRFAYVRTTADEGSAITHRSNRSTFNDVSVTLHYRFNKHWSSYIERVEGYQLPFIDQQTYSSSGQFITSFALKPTTSVTYQGGVVMHYATLEASVDLYQINDKNEVGFVCTSATLCANVNLPKTRARGISATESWHLTKQISWQNTINAEQHKFVQSGDNSIESGNTVPGVPLVTWLSLVRYQFLPSWTWSISGQYERSYFAEGDYGNQGPKAPYDIIMDSSLAYQHKAWLVSLAVNNLTNRTYYEDTSFVGPTVLYYPADGISGILTVSYNF